MNYIVVYIIYIPSIAVVGIVAGAISGMVGTEPSIILLPIIHYRVIYPPYFKLQDYLAMLSYPNYRVYLRSSAFV